MLLTGANGSIGKVVCNRFAELGVPYFPVFRQDYDLLNHEQVKKLMVHTEPTHIVHLAGNPSSKPNLGNPYKIWDDNVLMTHILLENCPKHTKWIFASSATVYGTYKQNEWDKGGSKEDDVLSPSSVYATTKIACESLIKTFVNQGKISAIILRLIANVGKYGKHGLTKDVVDKLLGPNKTLDLFGDNGGTVKPFIHVNDTTEVILKSINYSATYDVFNVGQDYRDNLSVQQVALSIMDELKIAKEIKWVPDAVWIGDNNKVCINSKKIMSKFNWKPNLSSVGAVRTGAREYFENING